MNPIKFVKRRPVFSTIVPLALIGGGIFALYKVRVDIPSLHTTRLYARMDDLGVAASAMKGRVAGKLGSFLHAKEEEEAHQEPQKIIVTTPLTKPVDITQPYVCQIQSQRHINVRALEGGYLQEILVKEGQAVKKGDLMFKIVPTLYQAKLDAENADAKLAQLKLTYTKSLFNTKFGGNTVVSQNDVFLHEAEYAHAKAKAELAAAELEFTNVKAPFDGIVDRLTEQLGSLIKEGDTLTTLSDNSVMWVYFNVPEKRYLEYMIEVEEDKPSPDIELMLANHAKFPHAGQFDPIRRKIGAIEASFNNETGNIAFRADFPNPRRLLRHGQTGTVLIHHVLKDAIVIPQRSTFENLAKRYVYVVGKDDVVHQHEIHVEHELDDVYVIEKGLDVNDKIILEGIRQVRDGDKVEYDFRKPEDVLANQKNAAQ